MAANTQGKKLFTAEIKRMRMMGQLDGLAGATAAADTSGVTNKDVLDAIEAIRNDLRSVVLSKPLTSSHAAKEEAHDEPEGLDTSQLLKNEIRALSHAIEDTKAEIAALRPADEDDDRLLIVANELDAIVKSTETATDAILEAAERIDDLAQNIRSSVNDDHAKSLADDILEQSVRMFEACNFQDLTGQRITKVVNTLKFIEERVVSMMEIWGEDEVAEAGAKRPVVVAVDTHEEAGLLNGPQDEAKAVSQDDIDSMFN